MVGRRQSNALFLREPLPPRRHLRRRRGKSLKRGQRARESPTRAFAVSNVSAGAAATRVFFRRATTDSLAGTRFMGSVSNREFLSHRTQKAQDGISSR